MYVLFFYCSLDFEFFKSSFLFGYEFSEYFNLSLGKSYVDGGMVSDGLSGLE